MQHCKTVYDKSNLPMTEYLIYDKVLPFRKGKFVESLQKNYLQKKRNRFTKRFTDEKHSRNYKTQVIYFSY